MLFVENGPVTSTPTRRSRRSLTNVNLTPISNNTSNWNDKSVRKSPRKINPQVQKEGLVTSKIAVPKNEDGSCSNKSVGSTQKSVTNINLAPISLGKENKKSQRGTSVTPRTAVSKALTNGNNSVTKMKNRNINNMYYRNPICKTKENK